MRIKVITEGHQFYNAREGEVLAWTNTVEHFDGAPMQVPAVLLQVDDMVELIPLKSHLRGTAIEHLPMITKAEADQAVESMRLEKNGAYRERNQCVALIARMALVMGLRAGTARTAIEGWSDDWHGCVYIDLPTGQVSWHFHDSQDYLFMGLPPYEGAWDGHDTFEKYLRAQRAFATATP